MKKLRIFLGKNGDDFEFEIISFIYFIQTVEFQLIRIQFLFPKVSCWLLFVWMENTYLKKGNLTNSISFCFIHLCILLEIPCELEVIELGNILILLLSFTSDVMPFLYLFHQLSSRFCLDDIQFTTKRLYF